MWPALRSHNLVESTPHNITSGLSAKCTSLDTDYNEVAAQEITTAEFQIQKQDASSRPQSLMTPTVAFSEQLWHQLVQPAQSLQNRVTEQLTVQVPTPSQFLSDTVQVPGPFAAARQDFTVEQEGRLIPTQWDTPWPGNPSTIVHQYLLCLVTINTL